jgi:hypothetical protein
MKSGGIADVGTGVAAELGKRRQAAHRARPRLGVAVQGMLCFSAQRSYLDEDPTQSV